MLSSSLDAGQTFDVIIAGGGAAGCVLASRLSENADQQVLLLEAGPDAAAPDAEHPDVLDPFCLTASHNPAFRWPDLVAELTAVDEPGTPSRVAPHLQGYGVGGGSNINGMAADRALPADYDEWSELGARGWAWQQVLPYFMKLEHELDFHGPDVASLHGLQGPMPVRRLPRASWAPFAAGIGEAVCRRGFPLIEDYMTDFRDGLSSVPTNCLPHRRMSVAMAYLTRDVRQRLNLRICAGARVERLSFEGRRANGVFVQVDGSTTLIRGRQVIISCGALQSPALLMRSGIGPHGVLAAHGIPVVQELPGVGANLQNHPCISLVMYLSAAAAQRSNNASFLQNWLRFSSHHRDCHPSDMHLMAFNKCAWHALGRRIGMVAVSVLKPYSKGSVEIASAAADSAPVVRFNLFGDCRDEQRLVDGLRLALELLADPAVVGLHSECFIPDARWVAGLDRRNAWNAFKARTIASLLEHEPLRRLALRKSRIDLGRLLVDRTTLHDFVRAHAHVQAHGCGTCRLGVATDRSAVVDHAGRVHGIDSLRVVDASIFPSIPRGYIHFVVIMAAEKLADAIKSEQPGS